MHNVLEICDYIVEFSNPFYFKLSCPCLSFVQRLCQTSMFELFFILSYLASSNSFLFSMCLQDLVQGFDQEVAAVVMARLASYKMEMEVTHVLC